MTRTQQTIITGSTEHGYRNDFAAISGRSLSESGSSFSGIRLARAKSDPVGGALEDFAVGEVFEAAPPVRNLSSRVQNISLAPPRLSSAILRSTLLRALLTSFSRIPSACAICALRRRPPHIHSKTAFARLSAPSRSPISALSRSAFACPPPLPALVPHSTRAATPSCSPPRPGRSCSTIAAANPNHSASPSSPCGDSTCPQS